MIRRAEVEAHGLARNRTRRRRPDCAPRSGTSIFGRTPPGSEPARPCMLGSAPAEAVGELDSKVAAPCGAVLPAVAAALGVDAGPAAAAG